MIMGGSRNSIAVALIAVGIGIVIGVPLGLLGGGQGRLDRRGLHADVGHHLRLSVAGDRGPDHRDLRAGRGQRHHRHRHLQHSGFRPCGAGRRRCRCGRANSSSPPRVAGKGAARITAEHILPNIANLLIVQGTIQFSLGILAEAGLSYVGLGAQPPTTSWGRMLAEAQTMMAIAPQMAHRAGHCDHPHRARPQPPGRWLARRARPQAAARTMTAPILTVEKLDLAIGGALILRSVDMVVEAGKVHALVGESGSGKSMTALTTMRLLPHGANAAGTLRFGEEDLLSATEERMCALRGDDIGMVFQEPMTALNPVKTIGEQVAEGIRWHTGANRADAERRAAHMLERVGLPHSRFPLDRYPHELSGGQRQRVVIAIACALRPKLLIADEPTTALDVVLQAQILDLLRELVAEDGMGLVLISHDLGVVAGMADDITILRHGEVQEAGHAVDVLRHQEHPYTQQLAEASAHVPHWPGRTKPADHWGLLEVQNLVRDYPGPRTGLLSRGEPFRAVDDVSFSVPPGRSVGLVGQSGCGKSTLARIVLALDKPTAGIVSFDGMETSGLNDHDAQMALARREMQVVFQDPYGSFNPRQTVEKLVAEPLHLEDRPVGRAERRERIAFALDEVGMPPDAMHRYPHEFSGGQRQRLAIARAIITRPKLVVCDEPVSALDVSIRAQILDLFAKLNDELGLAYLFITHDLTVARAITHEVMVMDHGRIVERGATSDVLDNPQTEAAQRLVAAAPDLQRAIERRVDGSARPSPR
jgi:peptide/nickel transport system ATP-binding protein